MNYCYLFRKLADGDQDGALTLHEFCVAMKLVLVRRKGDEIPSSLPESLVQRRKKQGIKCYHTTCTSEARGIQIHICTKTEVYNWFKL